MAMAIGISYYDFWNTNPHIISIYMKAHEKKLEEIDKMMWMMGRYVYSALDSTVCNNSLWRKKTSKPGEYPKYPFSMSVKESANKESVANSMSEEEKKRKRQQLFAKLNIMSANWNINHKKEKESDITDDN